MFELSTERYGVYFRIQPKSGKIRTRKTPIGTFFKQWRGQEKKRRERAIVYATITTLRCKPILGCSLILFKVKM